MPMTINTNLISLNAQRNLATSQSSLATSMQRLSSGLRVNSAKDDAAGLAIATRMDAQARGMNVAMRNANDGDLAGADGRRRAGQRHQHAAAHARARGAGRQRHQLLGRPRQPEPGVHAARRGSQAHDGRHAVQRHEHPGLVGHRDLPDRRQHQHDARPDRGRRLRLVAERRRSPPRSACGLGATAITGDLGHRRHQCDQLDQPASTPR